MILKLMRYAAINKMQSYIKLSWVLAQTRVLKSVRMAQEKCVIVLYLWDYFNKFAKIILDTNKFQQVKAVDGYDHPILQNENKIKSFLYKNVKNSIEKDTYDNISPSGSQPGKLYGECKMQKEACYIHVRNGRVHGCKIIWIVL